MKTGIFTLALACVAAPVLAQTPKPVRRASPSLLAKVDSIFLPYARPDRPGYAIAIVQNGRLRHARGYGSANLDYQIPLTPQSVFHVASLSKQFTAAAVAILIRQGKVTLKDPVKAHIPSFPDYPGPVCIEHLIYMTSGLAEYYTLPRANGRDWDRDYFTVQDAIAATLAQPTLLFRPGSRWAYSNVNYQILAEIVERVSGSSFASFVDREIFRPLNMTRTLVNDDLGDLACSPQSKTLSAGMRPSTLMHWVDQR